MKENNKQIKKINNLKNNCKTCQFYDKGSKTCKIENEKESCKDYLINEKYVMY